ncbi:MAG: NUDIX domain-containing protein [Patescibacteria group bacterium]
MDKNIIWIDENENDLSEVSVSKAHQEGLLHRISVIYLTNDKNQILIQKRSDGRLDHSAAGHVDAGESYLEAAKRELEEELGVSDVTLTEIGDCSSKEAGGKIRHKFKIFRCKTNPGKLDPDEVEEVFWADPSEVWNDMKRNNDKKYCAGFKSTLRLFLKELSSSSQKMI